MRGDSFFAISCHERQALHRYGACRGRSAWLASVLQDASFQAIVFFSYPRSPRVANFSSSIGQTLALALEPDLNNYTQTPIAKILARVVFPRLPTDTVSHVVHFAFHTGYY